LIANRNLHIVFKIRICKEIGGDAQLVGRWKLIKHGGRGNNLFDTKRR